VLKIFEGLLEKNLFDGKFFGGLSDHLLLLGEIFGKTSAGLRSSSRKLPPRIFVFGMAVVAISQNLSTPFNHRGHGGFTGDTEDYFIFAKVSAMTLVSLWSL
jgi:hypothetical protein